MKADAADAAAAAMQKARKSESVKDWNLFARSAEWSQRAVVCMYSIELW